MQETREEKTYRTVVKFSEKKKKKKKKIASTPPPGNEYVFFTPPPRAISRGAAKGEGAPCKTPLQDLTGWPPVAACYWATGWYLYL